VSFDSIQNIWASGFEGFIRVADLQKSACGSVPPAAGVYLVLRTSVAPPQFLRQSTGGHFKGRDPTVSVSVLKKKWVDGALVLNIGKAGPSKGRTLKSRLRQYMQFGEGKPVRHWGGRYIWQLHDSDELLVCWKSNFDTAPRDAEESLLREFESVYRMTCSPKTSPAEM